MDREVDDSYSWIVWGVPLIIVLFLLCLFLSLYLLRRYLLGSMYKGEAMDMTGKIVLITGANTGIGKEAARDLSRRGAKVTLLCRNLDKANAAASDIRQDTGNSVDVVKLDLSSFASIRECAEILKEKHPKIDCLINNAGVASCPEWKTEDGLEMQIGTNHFGHFLLTLLLLDNIKAAAPSRIVSVSSIAHKFIKMNWDDLHMKKKYVPLNAYAQSKLCNVMFSGYLARKLKDTGVHTYIAHPGYVQTDVMRHMDAVYGSVFTAIERGFKNFKKDALLGAQTTIACAVDKKFGKDTGEYYYDSRKGKASKDGRNKEYQDRLWKISLETVGLGDFVV